MLVDNCWEISPASGESHDVGWMPDSETSGCRNRLGPRWGLPLDQERVSGRFHTEAIPTGRFETQQFGQPGLRCREALRDNPVCQARGTSQSSDYESYSGSSPLEPIMTKTGEKSSDLLDNGMVDPAGRSPAIELFAGISHTRSTTPRPQLHAHTPRPVRESLREADLDSSSWRMLEKAIGGILMFAGASTTGVSQCNRWVDLPIGRQTPKTVERVRRKQPGKQ